MPIFVVERVFNPPITVSELSASGERLAPCIKERDINAIVTYFAADGSRAICIFEAADAERVREANRVAGAPFERVWATQSR